ncbi:Rho termination protein [filamentous cyanobacterium CCT1]|nr:Rho termination protein [filamentous cyanobacterium CCT1]PSN75879.1 Rho termination protein [filamentous cyanobacterium CCP4]
MSSPRPPLEDMTLRQLRKVASEYEVSRYSRMRKTELIEAIQAIDAKRGAGTAAAPATVAPVSAPVGVAVASTPTPSYSAPTPPSVEVLASVDDGLADLPSGYGESRIVLMPRDPQWAYAYWDIPNTHKDELRRQGGSRLALRFYDVTDIDFYSQAPHSLQQYECDEMAREWYLPIPVSDRDYVAEIGYLCNDGRWLVLARSLPVHIPPVYPSDWVEDHFMTVDWQADLRGKTLMILKHPSQRAAESTNAIYDSIFAMTESAEAQRVAGSLFGSMQHVPASMAPEKAVSSYVFPSGAGLWAVPGAAAGVPTMSGIGAFGELTMSGAGFSASAPPIRPRKFWLVADAELIVYGATEPDATVTIGGQPIKLNSDGTFRFQMSFQDGNIDYPIMAVAADGEQTRAIHMTFDRATPSRRTNTKDEAVLEWLP